MIIKSGLIERGEWKHRQRVEVFDERNISSRRYDHFTILPAKAHGEALEYSLKVVVPSITTS